MKTETEIKIEKLEKELEELRKKSKKEKEEAKHLFKIGDWVCVNNGEYSFETDVWQITHYDQTTGYPSSKTRSEEESLLRLAHEDEINYKKADLPMPFLKGKKRKIKINNLNFEIEDLFNNSNSNGKIFLDFLLESNWLNNIGIRNAKKIINNLK